MTDTTIAEKIAKATLEVGGKLSTDKRNEQQRYDYISADKILTICGQALANAGVVIFPAIIAEETDKATYTNNQGKEATRYDATVDYLMTISDGAEKLEFTWCGRGSDYSSPDKAMYKAITSGHKYFLAKLLMVGAGNEDGEHDGDDEPKIVTRSERKPELKPAPAPTAEPSAAIDLETAKAVTNSNGEKYGDLDNDKLANICNGIVKAMAKPDVTPERRAELQYKRDAALTIIRARG